MMEKRKKDKLEEQTKLTKKKSKPQLHLLHSPKKFLTKSRKALEETKDSFNCKPAIRKSASSGKHQKENIQRAGSALSFHPKGIANTRYLTEALPNKTNKEGQPKKLFKSSLISPQRTTFHDVYSRTTKDRLSLNESHKQRNPESAKATSTLGEELSMKEVNVARKDIQEAIKRTCLKDSISKKDFLKITNQYEKLITRIVFSEVVQNKQEAVFQDQNEESLTFRVEKGPKGKNVCPGLQLGDIKALKIDDYHDEFMAHYDELSESWKRDIAVQRRY